MKEDYQIIHGDCLQIMKGMADKSIDLVLTDPPYGIGAGGILSKNYKHKSETMAANRTDYGTNNWDTQTPSQEVFDEILRVSKKQIIFGGQYFTDKLPSKGKWIVWDKKVEEKYQNDFADVELAWTSENGAPKIVRHLWHGMIQQDMKNKDTRFHPTQKPLEVMKWCLELFSNKNDLILDPFAGSCTTLIASKQLDRKCICIEKEEEYVTIGRERLATSTNVLF